MSTFLLLQRLELFPESALSKARSRSVFSLQDLDASVNTGRRDASGVEWMAEIHNGARGLHHWVLLVVLDELAEGRELFAAADVVFVVLQKRDCESISWELLLWN